MNWSLDARVPVILVQSEDAMAEALRAGPSAVLAAGELPARPMVGAVAALSFEVFSSHAVACACCGGRSPAAQALDRLFQARVRGTVAWFDRVVALVPGEAARDMVEGALRDDAVSAARFRMEPVAQAG
ncbi:hypothetical protein [Roseomonas elaeocarpi]|uniref:Uncharacterized protein n=1 Tax=Roseomonas elaeocarpi TaxID=907779 RepID=A0ABV6JWK7_9PROT